MSELDRSYVRVWVLGCGDGFFRGGIRQLDAALMLADRVRPGAATGTRSG